MGFDRHAIGMVRRSCVEALDGLRVLFERYARDTGALNPVFDLGVMVPGFHALPEIFAYPEPLCFLCGPSGFQCASRQTVSRF